MGTKVEIENHEKESCSRCGRSEPDAGGLRWVLQSDSSCRLLLCPTCAREVISKPIEPKPGDVMRIQHYVRPEDPEDRASETPAMRESLRWIRLGLHDVPFSVEVRPNLKEGRLVCTGLRLGALDEPEVEITPRNLRKIYLPRILDEVRDGMPDTFPNPADRERYLEAIGLSGLLDADKAPLATPPKRPGPKGQPPEHFARVAEVYRRGLKQSPQSPVKYLRENLYPKKNALGTSYVVPEATAHRWLKRAHDLGELP